MDDATRPSHTCVMSSAFLAVSRATEKLNSANNNGLLLHCSKVQLKLWSKRKKETVWGSEAVCSMAQSNAKYIFSTKS